MLDGLINRVLRWTPVGGSSSGRTSVSGSDYLGSIPSPPANLLLDLQSFRRTALGDRLAVGRQPLELAT